MIKYALRDLIKIGHIYHTTGIKGYVVCEIEQGVVDRKDVLNYLFVAINGQSVPYFVDEIVDLNTVSLKLRDIDNPEDAKGLVGKDLYLDRNFLTIHDIDVCVSTNDIIGFQLLNKGTYIGQISAILEYPGQDVLTLENFNDVVIPLVPEWIIDINPENKTIDMSFDEELLGLNK